MSKVMVKDDTCFELKADFFPITVLKITEYNLEAISAELEKIISSAPKYFAHAPIVIDVINLRSSKVDLNIDAICQILREKRMIPIGVRGLSPKEQSMAINAGLAVLKTSHSLDATSPANDKKSDVDSTATKAEKTEPQRKTTIIDKPVRSGTQIYAKDSDLIVLAAINAGAECIADGNIHVYGPLRGKALAGASGNKEARIFCESLEAELIAIAGHYLVHEQIKPPKNKKPILQVYLENDKLLIDGI